MSRALIVGSGRRDEPLVDVLSANIAAAAVADPGYRWTDLVDVRSDRCCATSRTHRCAPNTSGRHPNRCRRSPG